MSLAPGTHLGPYTIVAPLGAGGMGAVYRADDPVLERPVAIKVLTRTGEGIGRELLREARAVSALNHPNICHVYQAGESDGIPFIAMELVEGRLLADTIPPGGMPGDTLVRYGIQLADALAHAHAHRIVHRDLKSGNVMVTPAGQLKVLDFGLALHAQVADVEAVTRSREHVTGVAGFAGTLPYMAPELLRGQTADERSDVWALGVMLYEMAAGRRPFTGNTGMELSAAILAALPPPLPARVQAGARAVIARCLAPDPARRYQHGGEVRTALETVLELLGERTGERVLPSPATKPSTWRWGLAAILTIVALIAAAWFASHERLPAQDERLRITAQRMVPLEGRPEDPTLSPDGRLIAYVAADQAGRSQIWVASLTEGRPVQITSGDAPAFAPFWSSGGEIFFGSGGDIWTVTPPGGTARRVVAAARNPSVSGDGNILAYDGLGVADGNNDVWVSAADGSNPRRVAKRSTIFPARPAISPDGRHVAYLDYEEGPLSDLWIAPVDGGEARRLTSDAVLMGSLAWMPDGRSVVFASTRGGSLTLWSIDAAGGAPQPVTSGAGEDDRPAISSDGRLLAYSNVRTRWTLFIRNQRTGTDQQVAEARSPFIGPSFSPDGTQIVFFRPVSQGVHVFVMRRDGTGLRQVTTTPGETNIFPKWSSDGRTLEYLQTRPQPSLRRIPAEGGASTAVLEGVTVANRPVIGPDGARVALLDRDRTVLRDLSSGAETVLSTPMQPTDWSPDGRLISGTVTTTKGARREWEVVVCDTADGTCRIVTVGHSARWTADGRRLFFLRPASPHRELWSIDLTGENLTAHGNVGPFRLDEVWFGMSPDDEVAFSQLRQDTPEVWLLEIAGSAVPR